VYQASFEDSFLPDFSRPVDLLAVGFDVKCSVLVTVVQALIPARLHRSHFNEGVSTPSLADAVQAAVSVSTRVVSSDEPNEELSTACLH